MVAKFRCRQVLIVLLGTAAWGFGAPALADPPTRVMRLAYVSGPVSFSPAGDDSWVMAERNRPLVAGDRLWTEPGARDELQAGRAALRMSGGTLLTVLNVDERVTQLQLSQGRLNFRVRRLAPDELFEIDTPNLAFSLRRPGDYRIDVDPSTTTVTVRNGQAEADGEGNAYLIDSGQSFAFRGTDLRDFQSVRPPAPDDFDLWASGRDRLAEQSRTARYVPRDMVGYQDLDQNGSWRTVRGYGNVWTPSQVESGWRPYRDGHWVWVEPWGWTWVDDAPWGYAVSHYGRWANVQGDWCWVPGPVQQQAVYAPALVAFVGLGLSASQGPDNAGVGWFPLAPREVYRPPYRVSRNYFTNINTSNTTVNRTQITNVYNNVNVSKIAYVNRQVPGAVTAVPAATFVQARPVAHSMLNMAGKNFNSAAVTPAAPVAPQRASLAGTATTSRRPAMAALTRPVLAKTAPPPPASLFAERQFAPVAKGNRQFAPSAKTGRPPEPAAPHAPSPAPRIKLLHLAQSGVSPRSLPHLPQAVPAIPAPRLQAGQSGAVAPPNARELPQLAGETQRPAPRPPPALHPAGHNAAPLPVKPAEHNAPLPSKPSEPVLARPTVNPERTAPERGTAAKMPPPAARALGKPEHAPPPVPSGVSQSRPASRLQSPPQQHEGMASTAPRPPQLAPHKPEKIAASMTEGDRKKEAPVPRALIKPERLPPQAGTAASAPRMAVPAVHPAPRSAEPPPAPHPVVARPPPRPIGPAAATQDARHEPAPKETRPSPQGKGHADANRQEGQ